MSSRKYRLSRLRSPRLSMSRPWSSKSRMSTERGSTGDVCTCTAETWLRRGPSAAAPPRPPAGATDNVAGDYGARLEEASVVDGHGAADNRPPQPRVEADVGVVPQDRVGDLRARIDGRIAPDHTRSVDPGPGAHFRARADQRRAVDARPVRDLPLLVDPDSLALAICGGCGVSPPPPPRDVRVCRGRRGAP